VNPTELEAKYIDRIRRISCLLLLPSPDAKQLVDDLATAKDVRLLGVEAYRILDNEHKQPLVLSNIRRRTKRCTCVGLARRNVDSRIRDL